MLYAPTSMLARRLSAYERYYQHAGLEEYERVFQFNSELDTEVDIYARRLAAWPGLHSPALRVLDIGCGHGTFTIKLLGALRAGSAQVGPKQHLTFDLVDINENAFAGFAAGLRRLRSASATVGQTAAIAWQDVSEGMFDGKYDLIIANHTFYGAPISADLIRSLLDRLAPNGRILLALCSRASDIYQMRRRVHIEINTGEDIAQALLASHCTVIRHSYDSKFYFDLAQPIFARWLFATAAADEQTKTRLIDEYRRNDGGLDYLTNRAMIHIVWHREFAESACAVTPPG